MTTERDKRRGEFEDIRKQRLDQFMSGFSVITSKLKEMYQVGGQWEEFHVNIAGKPLNKGIKGDTILCPFKRSACLEVHLPLMYIIGGRLLVHFTEGNCSIEVSCVIIDNHCCYVTPPHTHTHAATYR